MAENDNWPEIQDSHDRHVGGLGWNLMNNARSYVYVGSNLIPILQALGFGSPGGAGKKPWRCHRLAARQPSIRHAHREFRNGVMLALREGEMLCGFRCSCLLG